MGQCAHAQNFRITGIPKVQETEDGSIIGVCCWTQIRQGCLSQHILETNTLLFADARMMSLPLGF